MKFSAFHRRLLLVRVALIAIATLYVGGIAHAEQPPTEVRIGFQKGAAILVLVCKQQVIEQRLKTLGVISVKWVEFQFGPSMLEAMGVGVIDLGSVGDMLPIFA